MELQKKISSKELNFSMKKFLEVKFKFEQDIVFNQKEVSFYLAKIFKERENIDSKSKI